MAHTFIHTASMLILIRSYEYAAPTQEHEASRGRLAVRPPAERERHRRERVGAERRVCCASPITPCPTLTTMTTSSPCAQINKREPVAADEMSSDDDCSNALLKSGQAKKDALKEKERLKNTRRRGGRHEAIGWRCTGGRQGGGGR